MKTNTKKAPAKATAKATPRTYLTIRWSKRLGMWTVLVSKQIIEVDDIKTMLVKRVARTASWLWTEHGVLSELRICNKAGQYQPARTYGHDPRSSAG